MLENERRSAAAPIYNQWGDTMKQLQEQQNKKHNTKMGTYSTKSVSTSLNSMCHTLFE